MAERLDLGTGTRRRLLRIWLLVALVLLVVVTLDPFQLRSVHRVGGALMNGVEAVLACGLLVYGLAPTLGRVPRGWLAAGVAGVVIVGGVQWLPDDPDAYPLVQWQVYTDPTTHVPWTEWTIVDADGEEDLPFWPTVPALPRPFIVQLDPWVDRAVDGDAEARSLLTATVTSVLGDAVPREGVVEVRRCDVAATSRPSPAEPTCRTVLVIDADELS